jgi:hypothetical protein
MTNVTIDTVIPNYTVTCDDGETLTSDASVFTLSPGYFYPPDPRSSNFYNFTISVDTPYNGQVTAGGNVEVEDANTASVTLSEAIPSTVAVGSPFTVAGVVSNGDPTFAITWIEVNYGDDTGWGAVGADPSFSVTKEYDDPGTYVLRIGGNYGVDPVTYVGSDDNTYDLGGAYSTSATVVVTEPTPTLSVGSLSVEPGASFDLAAAFTAGANLISPDPSLWTVSWGDGTSDASPVMADNTDTSGGVFDATFNHQYQSATLGQTYHPQVTVTNVDGTFTGTGTVVVLDDPSTINLVPGTGVAYEAGESPDTLSVTRDGGDETDSLVVSYSLSSDLPTTAYIVTDGDGQILDGTVTIPEGDTEADIVVYPLEDDTPRWTESIDVSLEADTAHYATGTATEAIIDVVNDDLTAYVDNGSDNIIMYGSSDGSNDGQGALSHYLILSYPDEERDGAEVTLSVSNPDEVDVWTSSNPDPANGDEPILGTYVDPTDGSTTTLSEVTWTYGTEDAPPAESGGKVTLWLGASDGDGNFADCGFTLSDDDSGATLPSEASPGESVRFMATTIDAAATQPSTKASATTNPITVPATILPTSKTLPTDKLLPNALGKKQGDKYPDIAKHLASDFVLGAGGSSLNIPPSIMSTDSPNVTTFPIGVGDAAIDGESGYIIAAHLETPKMTNMGGRFFLDFSKTEVFYMGYAIVYNNAAVFPATPNTNLQSDISDPNANGQFYWFNGPTTVLDHELWHTDGNLNWQFQWPAVYAVQIDPTKIKKYGGYVAGFNNQLSVLDQDVRKIADPNLFHDRTELTNAVFKDFRGEGAQSKILQPGLFHNANQQYITGL